MASPPPAPASSPTADAVPEDAVETDVAAVVYTASPSGMGTGPAWLEKERVLLCEAWIKVGQCPIRGADQRVKLMYESMLEIYRRDLKDVPNIRERRKRNVEAIKKEWEKINKRVMSFACFFNRVENMNLTGNLTLEDRISTPVALSCSMDVYEAIKRDRASDKASGKRRKRTAMEALCEYVSSWRKLRGTDKYGTAAAAAALAEAAARRWAPGGRGGGSSAGGSCSAGSEMHGTDAGDTDEDGIVQRRGFQARPTGNKLAKQEHLADITTVRELKEV